MQQQRNKPKLTTKKSNVRENAQTTENKSLNTSRLSLEKAEKSMEMLKESNKKSLEKTENSIEKIRNSISKMASPKEEKSKSILENNNKINSPKRTSTTDIENSLSKDRSLAHLIEQYKSKAISEETKYHQLNELMTKMEQIYKDKMKILQDMLNEEFAEGEEFQKKRQKTAFNFCGKKTKI